jgi:hypothetical protein
MLRQLTNVKANRKCPNLALIPIPRKISPPLTANISAPQQCGTKVLADSETADDELLESRIPRQLSNVKANRKHLNLALVLIPRKMSPPLTANISALQ